MLRFLLFVFHPPQNIIKKFYTVSVSAFSFYLKKKTPAKEKQTRGFTPRPRQRRAAVLSLRLSIGCSAHSHASALELERMRACASCFASRSLACLRWLSNTGRGYLKPDDKIWLNYLLLSCYGSIDRQIPIFNHIIYKNPDRYYTAGLKAALSALCIFAGCFFVLPGDKASYYLEKRRRYHAGGGFI